MERLENITIIFLLAVGFFTSTAPAKTVSVLPQEGLYAEEIQGDLDAAIKIYEQVISESKETQRAAAQATYRIGMCYLKKGEKAKAAEQFQNVISKYSEQKALTTKSQEQLKKLGPPTVGVFGPAMERVINDDGEEKDWLIDFDTGKLFTHPTEIPSEEALSRWIAENHIDAVGETGTSGPGIYGFEMAVIPIANERWETISPKELEGELSIAKAGTPVLMSAKGDLPVAYIFKTREGGMGIVQIMEMQDKKKPRHLKIRYKMLLDQAKTAAGGWRKVFLPDADTKGTDVVLDFASGELLPAGEGDRQLELVGTFAELGKGDLAYDRVLICLRGAKAELIMPDHAVYDLGEHLVRLKVLEKIEDVTAYQLDIGHIPGRYLVTTGEDKDYEVNILSADARGVELIYKKATGYKLVERRFEFGPEVERIMQAQGQRDSWIDFDTGRTYPHPEEVVRNGDEKDIIAWARMHGIDAFAGYTISGLALHDMTAVRLDESDWNHLTPSQLAKAVSRRDAQIKSVKIDGFDFVKLTSIPGSTFGFKTREGGLGILQVVDFMKEPWRVKIRYKMLQQKLPYIETLIKEMHEPEAQRFAALNKLIKIGAPAVGPLISELEKSNNWQVPKALGAIGDKRAIEPLIDKWQKCDWSPMKEVIAEALERITGKKIGQDKQKWEKWWQETRRFISPEATIRNFMAAAMKLDMNNAMVYVAGDSHDYKDIQAIFEKPEHPFNVIFRKTDPAVPVKTIETKIIDNICEAVWQVTFKEDFTIKGKTFKAGETFGIDGNLHKYGDKWLITGI